MAAAVLFCLCSPAAFASSMDNFVVINTYTGNFTDVSEDQWFFENVKTCYEYGLMIGTNEEGTIFEPVSYTHLRSQFIYFFKEHHYFKTTGWVQISRGLIGNYHLRIIHKRSGNGNSLLLSAR